MPRIYDPLPAPLRVILSATVVAAVLASAVYLDFNLPFLGYGVAAAFLFHLSIRPSVRELGGVVLAALLLAGATTYFHVGAKVPLNLVFWLGMLGLASFLVLGLRMIATAGEGRRRVLWALLPAIVLVFFIVGSQHSLNMGSMLRPQTYDLYTFLFDGSLGFEPAFAVGRLVSTHPWLYQFTAFTYTAITLAIAVLYAVHLHYRQDFAWDVIEVLFGAAIIGYLFFAVFPVCGPTYGFPAYFPNVPVSYEQMRQVTPEMVPIRRWFPRNGVPSLHMTWALLMWWSLRRFPRWLQFIGALYAGITLFDTMAVGEHYAFDLIVAFPFSLSMQALLIGEGPLSSRRRWLPAAAGFAAFVGMLALVAFGGLHFLLLSPVIPWVIVLACVGGSVLWAYKLPLPERTYV